VISAIITGGYGSFGTPSLIVTMGYGIGAAGPTMPDVTPQVFYYEVPETV
jgi:hypothetical protein